jgi:hypothetical protein
MKKNTSSQKSSKYVQLGSVMTEQPKTINLKDMRETRDISRGSKVDSSQQATALTHERIAERARAIWQKNGCKSGEDERNWSEAEAQLKAELAID